MLEFKVNSSLFQSEVELSAVKQKIKEILRRYRYLFIHRK